MRDRAIDWVIEELLWWAFGRSELLRRPLAPPACTPHLLLSRPVTLNPCDLNPFAPRPLARLARWWLARQARRGSRSTVRWLWFWWGVHADPIVWDLLERTGRTGSNSELAYALSSQDPAVRATALAAVVAQGRHGLADWIFKDRSEADVALLREMLAWGLLPSRPGLRARVLLAAGDLDGHLALDADGSLLTGHLPGSRWPRWLIAEQLRALELEEWFVRLRRDDPPLAESIGLMHRQSQTDLVHEAMRSSQPRIVAVAARRCRTASRAELPALWAQALRSGALWPALLDDPAELDAGADWPHWALLRDHLLAGPFIDVLECSWHLARHHPPELAVLRPALDTAGALTHYARVTRSSRIKPILRRSLAEMTGDDLAVVRWIQRSAHGNPRLRALAKVIEECRTALRPAR
ncbi:hypothetical protein GCM10022419_084600 [Nonomuraea rosea]|uniref:HEAT repeat domain-containing protein n=1 Tax=Nonomuraea rosea TaxID=638574 RepID=A0ABP6YRB6_9ACTN